MSEDERPRLYGKIVTDERSVELTVQGSVDEKSDDLTDTFHENLSELLEAAKNGESEDNDRMCQ